MAESYSIANIENELSVINLEDIDTKTELQLAAEIGQLLLERNQVLESTLEKNQQLIFEQQAEINKLVKASQHLQDINDSSQKTSEQLEQSLLECERYNQQLLKLRTVDQDKLKELKERKEFLEHRCETLEESYEFIEDKLMKTQEKVILCDSAPLNTVSISSDSAMESELVNESPRFDENRLSKRLEYLSTDLTDTKCEMAMYHSRMERLESQLSMLLQKNMELEDILASKRSTLKSPTSTSGCSSDPYKNSTSLAEEIEAAKMSQSMELFADGLLTTSTPPKLKQPKRDEIDNETDTVIDISTEEDVDRVVQKKDKTKKHKTRKAAYTKRLKDVSMPMDEHIEPSEHKVRINVSIEIEPDENKRRKETKLCHHYKSGYIVRTMSAIKKTLVTCLSKVLGSIINRPLNYLGTLLLWHNKRWIERNIRIM